MEEQTTAERDRMDRREVVHHCDQSRRRSTEGVKGGRWTGRIMRALAEICD